MYEILLDDTDLTPCEPQPPVYKNILGFLHHETRDEVERRIRQYLDQEDAEILPFEGTDRFPLQFLCSDTGILLYNFKIRDCIGTGIWTYGPSYADDKLPDYSHYVLWCS